MNEIIGIIPHKFRRRGFGVACTLLLRAGLNFLGLAVLLPVLALALDARSLDGGGQLARIYTALGFTSPRSFALTVCAAVVAVIVLKCLTNLWLARIERNYIYDLYRTLSRRLYVTYHDRGLPFVKSSNSAVLARNVNVVCLAFTAGVLKPAAAIAAEAMLLTLLFGALLWYAPVAAALAVAVFLPSVWIYYGLVRNRINRYGELENKAQREKARLVAETFRGYADIEINNAFPMMLRSFDRAMDRVIRTRLRETAIGMLPQAFTEIGLALGMALLVALSLGAEEGRAQLLFGVFAVAALRLMPSVRSIMAGWTSIKYNRYTIAVLRDATAGDEPSSAPPDTLSDAAMMPGKDPTQTPPLSRRRNTPRRRAARPPAAGELLRTNEPHPADKRLFTAKQPRPNSPAPQNQRNPFRPAAHPEHARPKYCLSNMKSPSATSASASRTTGTSFSAALRSRSARANASASAAHRAQGKRRFSTCCWDFTNRPEAK